MPPYIKTRQAIRELGLTYWQLVGLLRAGKIDPPQKDCSGDYIWTPRDLERVRKVLRAYERRKAEVPA